MEQGNRVLQWAHQHGYSIAWIAEQIGYPPGALNRALQQDRISQEMADALQKRFGLRVYPTLSPCDQQEPCSGCEGG